MKMFFAMMFAFVTVFLGSAFANAYNGGGGSKFVQEYTYDFAVQGGAVGFIALKTPANALPQGGIVTSMYYMVQTAFTSGGSATVALGDAAAGARYLAATAYNNGAYAANTPALAAIGVPVYVSSANIASPGITVATAALTGGKMKFVVEGYVPKQ